MSTKQKPPSPARGTDSLDLPLMAGSVSQDWLAHMILTVKTIAAGAEFVPVPYIRAAFGTVVILLETVDKMKKNRDDLLDLCESLVEIVRLLQAEISAHGQVAGVRFMGLCKDFTSFVHMLQTQLEMVLRNRGGLRGRFKEFLGATTVADQIVRYRNRVNELRSNFLLIAAIDTNLTLAQIQKDVTAAQESSPITHIHQFRRVAVGDINLLYETAMSSKVYKVKVFTARISGESSLMTVAKYEDENERWKSDLELYSRLRHPNVWQLFGFAATPDLHALIYHDELIPLKIYRHGTDPPESSQHHCWSVDGSGEKSFEPTICVKRQPVQLCLAMPLLGNDSEDDETEHALLSLWHTGWFRHHNPGADNETVSNILTLWSPGESTLSGTLAMHIDWGNFFAGLIPLRDASRTTWNIWTQLSLGSVVAHRSGGIVPIAYIPHSSRVLIRNWELFLPPGVYSDPGMNTSNRFAFLPGSFKPLELARKRFLLSCSISLDEGTMNAVSMSWLSQANLCIRQTIPDGLKPRCPCGVVEKLWCAVTIDVDCHHLLREEGTLQKAYIFLQPVSVTQHSTRIGLDFPGSDQVYWSLDPTGNVRMTQDECDCLGLPRLQFRFLPTGRFWHEYQYNAIRELFQAKNFDPHSYDVTRLLGLPLAEIESNIPPSQQV
ncbi:hypothetical protein B0H14DRAFT_2681616 [Mycena olivaceomarginata]|nr:hypothetical protein B0H14DRAFT_2681616 [Mycena olivaceomarginata]